MQGQPLPTVRVSADGRYELLDTIGRGGMAKVVAATCRFPLDENRPCAIKFMYPAESRRAFSAEALTGWMRCNHPNLVAVYDYGIWPGDIPYQVMERVYGPNLYQACQGEHAYEIRHTWDMVRRIARDLASAINHLHHHEVLHCDIKPHNILLSTDGNVKLADLGVARLITDDPADVFQGSPAFASPEALACKKLDERSDAWSLGAVLYWLLTGHPPYGTGSPRAIRDAINTQARASFPTGTPLDLGLMINGLLTTDPDRRLTIDALLEGLESQRQTFPLASKKAVAVFAHEWHRVVGRPSPNDAAAPDRASGERQTVRATSPSDSSDAKEPNPVDAMLRQYVNERQGSSHARDKLRDIEPEPDRATQPSSALSQHQADQRASSHRMRWLVAAALLGLALCFAGIWSWQKLWSPAHSTAQQAQTEPDKISDYSFISFSTTMNPPEKP